LVGLKNTYYVDIMTQIAIYAILAIGLNIVVGFSGLLDLGYVGFYAAGAYTYAIFATSQANKFMPESLAIFPLSGNWFWLFLPISMLVAAVIGILLGLPVLRLKGDYLAIVTLGFGEIIRIVLNNLDKPINFNTQGASGNNSSSLFGMFNTPIHYYFISLTLLGLLLFFQVGWRFTSWASLGIHKKTNLPPELWAFL
jgi:branched-chain amino acid transport system permease protein